MYLCCSLSLSQFQPIFVFVPISAVPSRYFKDMSLLVFYYCICAFLCRCRSLTHLCVVCHHICRPKSLFQGHVTVGILLLYLHFSLSLSQVQPIFVLFVKISAILSLCFKDMSLFVFSYCICTFLCYCCSFKSSLCRLSPYLPS